MMLCPPILMTLTHGRMAWSGVASVAFWIAASLSDPPARRRPSAVSMALSGASGMSATRPFLEPEDPQLEFMPLGQGPVERTERLCRPFAQPAHRLVLHRRRQ